MDGFATWRVLAPDVFKGTPEGSNSSIEKWAVFHEVVLEIICSDSPYGVFVVYFEDPDDLEKYDIRAGDPGMKLVSIGLCSNY